MSFVHCSSCHRAYDLRRSAGCPSCQQKAEAAAKVEAAKVEAARVAEEARLEAARVEAARVAEEARVEAARLEAAPPARLADEAELVEDFADASAPLADATGPSDELVASREAPRADRIVAMVEELAALLERASTVELEAAQQQLHQRGLRAPWTAQLGSGGRFLLAAGSQLVTSAIRAPQQGARKLARRLRDAWSGNNPRA